MKSNFIILSFLSLMLMLLTFPIWLIGKSEINSELYLRVKEWSYQSERINNMTDFAMQDDKITHWEYRKIKLAVGELELFNLKQDIKNHGKKD